MGAARNLFTVPSGIPFARALCEGVIERCGGDPLLISDALLLVPTRRAARTWSTVAISRGVGTSSALMRSSMLRSSAAVG